jgi:5,10-methenyltetrahydrofolate synthetase
MGMDRQALMRWRKGERGRLIAARVALDPAILAAWRRTIDALLERAFPGLAGKTLALCWPIKNEYDARHLAHRLRARGTRTVLPVVLGAGKPLEFREWHPGVRMAKGALGIPYPVDGLAVAPEVVLLPMNGWDMQGYRLGYGGGFFDRTLAAFAARPVVIGVTYEMARIDTIHPQDWDIPVDYVATERGLYRRDAGQLVFLGMPEPGGAGALASPVCYADERHFGGDGG